jgi:hypothetical protein
MVGATPRGAAAAPLFGLAHLGDGLVGHGAFLLEALRTGWTAAAAGDADASAPSLRAVHAGPHHVALEFEPAAGKTLLATVERVPGACYPPAAAIADDDKERLLHLWSLRHAGAAAATAGAAPTLPLLLSLHDAPVAVVQQTEAPSGHKLALVVEVSGDLHVWAFWQPGSGGKTVRLGGAGSGSGKGSHAHPTASPTWVRLARVALQEYVHASSSQPFAVRDAHWDGTALLLATTAADGGSDATATSTASAAVQLWAVPLTVDIATSGRPSADIVVDDALPLLPHAAPLALPASFHGALRQRALHPGPAGVWALGSEQVVLWPPRAGTVAGAAMPTAHVLAKPLQPLLESGGAPAWGTPAAASPTSDAPAKGGGASVAAVLSAAVHAATGELVLLRGDGSLVALAASRSPGAAAAASTVDGWQLSCRALSWLERLPALLQRLGAGGVTAQLLPHRQLAVVLLTLLAPPGGNAPPQQLLLAHDAATGLLMQGFDLRSASSGSGGGGGYHLWSAGGAPGGPVAFGVASPTSLLTVLEPPIEVYAQRLAARLAAAAAPLVHAHDGGSGSTADARAHARLASHALRSYLCRAFGGDAAASSGGGNRGDWDGASLPFTHWGVRYALDWAFDALTAAVLPDGSATGGAFPPTFYHPALASAAAPAATAVPAFPSLLASAGRLWREIASSSPPLALIFASAAAAAPEAAAVSAAGGCAPDSATAVRLLVPLLRILGVRRWAVLQALKGRPVGAAAAAAALDGGSRAAVSDAGSSTPGAATAGDTWGGGGTGLVALASPDEVLALVLKRAHGHVTAAASGHHHHHGSHRHVHRASSSGSADAVTGKGRSPTGHRGRLNHSEQPSQQHDSHRAPGGGSGRRTQDSDDILASALAADATGDAAADADGGADHDDSAAAGSGGDMDWVLQRLAGSSGGGGASAGTASSPSARSGPSGLRLVEAPPLQPSHAASGSSGLPPTGRGGRAGSTAGVGGSGTPAGVPGGVEPLDDGDDDSDAWDEPPPPEFLRFLTPHNVALVPRLLECLRLHSLLLTVLGGVTATELAGGGSVDASFDSAQPHAALATALSGGGSGSSHGGGALLRAAHAFLQQSVVWADNLASSAAAVDALSPGSAATAPLLALLPLTAPQPSPHSLSGALRRLRDAEAAATGRPAAAALEAPSADGSSAKVSLGDVYWHGQAVAADGARGALLRQLGVVVPPLASAHGASTPVGGADAAAHRQHHHHADPSLLHPSLLEAEPCIALPLGAVPAGVAAARARHALTGHGHGHAPLPAMGVPLSVSPPPPPSLELVVRLLYRSGSTRDKRRITALVRRIESALPPAQRGRTPASLASYLHVTQADAGAAAEARRRLVRGTRSAAVRALLALPPDSLVGPYAAATAAGSSGSGASADGDADAPGSPAVSSPDSDDGVPAAILPHVTLLLELHRGTDALRVLLRAGCWGASLKMLEAAEEADGYTHGRDEHPLKDVRFDAGAGGASSEGRSASRGLRSAATLAAGAAATAGGNGGTLAQLSAAGCLTVGGLADHVRRARGGGGGSPAASGGGGTKLKPGSGDRSSNFAAAAAAADDDVDVTSAGGAGGGTDKASVDAAQRRMQAWRQTSTLGMATATASALRWSREAVTRVAHFNAMMAAALRDGDARRLEALWRRLPPACTLPSVLASLRAALAEDEADSWAGRIPAGSVLPALEALHAAHCRDMEEQARFWRQHGTVRRVDNVLRGWGSSK